MTNSWSLLAHHLEGTMDEVFPIKTEFKYNEDEILDSIKEYVGKTYSKHYSNKIQTLDLIDSVGDASAFCRRQHHMSSNGSSAERRLCIYG